MAKYLNISLFCGALLGLAACANNSDGGKEQLTETPLAGDSNDILTGTMTVIVDETVADLLEQQVDVFRSSYINSTVKVVADAERPAINRLLKGEGSIAVLKRELTAAEAKGFTQRSIKPRVFAVGYDAVIFVTNAQSSDSTISYAKVGKLMNGSAKGEQNLVFDDINSSSLRLLKEVTGVEKVSAGQVTAVGSDIEVINTVQSKPNTIGVLTLNQYLARRDSLGGLNKIRILSVSKEDNGVAFRPSQSTLGDDTYPLKQEFFVLNYQPNMGLGIGFSAFLTGDRGQRVVLKYGLLPFTMPGRELIIREEANF
ncbi:substrate-binding domain-containing protein [Sphingobacterium sp. lm-10]|uniref:PstS family phosphate ABC transporter substrate-binding protein n=1 Tax=Sphingobacterium sp. lm-10 TaxID=2944904 RepID=UPI0020206980|nr:substrate-binding domain-containing protein [Sphingobacterium sp. lm-10]MCL7988348.1 substrate-binding domain-containing protein [Sphingobacterium sp. lm-10]